MEFETKTSGTQSATPCASCPAVAETSSSEPTGRASYSRFVVLDDDPDDEPIVIHAMPLRPKFHRYLR
jgi:hypothetical protein